MLLVVDANILFAAAIKDSTTAELMFSDRLELIAPEHIFSEFNEYRAEILEKTERSSADFDKFMFILWNRIGVVPHDETRGFITRAEEISPDPDDVQYFALSLKYGCAVWSNDGRLKGQSEVKVLTTEDLVKLLGL